MKDLHEKQVKILNLLKQNINNPLTLSSISHEVGIQSPGVFYHHLRQLEKKGYLKRNPNDTRDYVILDSKEDSIVYVAKYGMAQCGSEGSMLDGNPIGMVPVPSTLLRFNSSDAFIVEARGNSMEPKINNGDIIIAKKQKTAELGNIVVCVYDEKVMIKQYLKVGNRIVLHSFNEEHELIEVRDDLRIEGVVKNILNYY